MEYHKLLQKQIKKLLPEDCLANPHFHKFIETVNESYKSFERDNELMNHAFTQSEEEYKEVLQNLNKEYESKQISISKMYNSLRSLDKNIEMLESENLEELSDYFSDQISKRKNIEKKLNHQFEFQKLLMSISSNHINIPFSEIHKSIQTSLKEIAEHVKADRAYVFEYDFNNKHASMIYEYFSSGLSSSLDIFQKFPIEPFETYIEIHKQGQSIIINDTENFEDVNLKELLILNNVKSVLAIPLMSNGECVGFIGFDTVKQYIVFGEDQKNLLSLFAQILSNIRERFFMEKNLTHTLELLKTLFENLQYGILVEDENRRILFTNQLFCEMFGIPLSPEDMQGIDCSNSAEESKHLFYDEEGFPNKINEILNNRKIVLDELLETKDGRFLERDYIPIYVNGKYRGHLWKYNDITKRVIYQNLLQESEERNRLIMNSSINAIINADEEGNICFWNKSAEIIFGWKDKEVFGKSLYETLFPNNYTEVSKINSVDQITISECPALNKQIELKALKKSGEEFPVEVAIIPLEQEGKKFFCSFIKDISERKRAEENLKIQEKKYHNIIENMNMGLLELDNNENIRYANQSFCDTSGYHLEEIIGKNPSELFLYSKNKNSVPLIKKQQTTSNKEESNIYQVPVKTKTGELKWWAISSAPNFDDKGNVIGTIGIQLDITDQKNMEEALKNEKERAQEASKAKEAFLANMSHEIRTPLNAIIGFLRELSKQGLNSTQNQYVENGINASRHLLSIINNVLDISKIEAGEMSLDNKDFSLKNSISNIVNILHSKALQKNLKLYYQFSNDIAPVLYGDMIKIEQILFNLVGNSLKFTNKGEVKIDCSLVEDKANKQKIKISISDTGIGMSNDFIDKIFKKFYQEDESIARRFGGTGLGMAITKELVKLMHGKISIESKKNVGTSIDIVLILQKGSLENLQPQEDSLSNIDVKNTRILLVEDNELNRMVAQNTLRNFGCLVTEAENGMEALKIIKRKEFDIILMDIQMPELDGIMTTEILRKKNNLSIPIIALTANAFKSEIEKCKSAGMDDYITKPFSEEHLLKTIYMHTKGAKQNNLSIVTKPINDEIYNLNSIKSISRDNEDFVKKMINIFIEQTESFLLQMHTHFESKNYLEISKIVHKIKPSIEGFAIYSIIDEVKKLEIKSKEKSVNHKELLDLFGKIEKTLILVVQALKDNEL